MKKKILGLVLLTPTIAYTSWLISIAYDSLFITALVVVGGGVVALVCSLIGLELITNS